jgi:ribonuclease HII
MRAWGGIDEAGYGPSLGPLVTTCLAAFSDLPPDREALSRLITGKSGKGIADSKKLFTPGKSLAALETAALGLLQAAFSREFTGFADLLHAATGDDPDTLFSDVPWYEGEDIQLPVSADTVPLPGAGELEEAGFSGFRVRTHVVSAPMFNRMLHSGMNKGEVLLVKVGDMLQNASCSGAPEMRVTVDRLGGRKYYRQFLLEQFAPVRSLKTMTETERESEYEVDLEYCRLRIRFAVKADAENVLTAGASCISKYIRELSMMMFNRYFARIKPGISPTQGYPQDAKRFIAEIEPAAGESLLRLLTREK